MLFHYLKISWRHLLKYKISAGIGVFGLAVGLLCFVVCCYCARMFLEVDQAFPNYRQIAEVMIKDEEGRYFSGTPAHMVQVLEDKFPGKIACLTAVTYPWDLNAVFELGAGKKATYVLNVVETDRHFKEVFSCRLIAGDWGQIERQKNAVVLSRKMARKIYGEESPLGKVLHPNEFVRRAFRRTHTPEDLDNIDYIVMGVMEDLPVNSSFSFLYPVDALMLNDAYGLLANQRPQEGGSGCSTYALLRPGVRLQELNEQVDVKKHGVLMGAFVYTPEFTPAGEEMRDRFKVFSGFYLGIGSLILLVALLNFFMFLTGNFLNRLREYHIRKGLGGGCKQLFGLLYTETLLYLVPVGILVFCLLELVYTWLDFGWGRRVLTFDIHLLYRQLLEYLIWGLVLFAAVCMGISAWLSRKYIRGALRVAGKASNAWGKNVMLGIQLVICCVFLTGSLALYWQSAKINDSLFPGLSREEKEHVLEVKLTEPQLKGREKFLIERMSRFPEVSEVLEADTELLSWETRGETRGEKAYFEYRILRVGSNFLSFLHMPLLGGQVFQRPGQAVGDPGIARWLGEEPLNKHLGNIDRPGFDVCGLTATLPDVFAEGSVPVLWTLSEQPVCCYLKVYPGSREVVEQKAAALLREWLPESIAPSILSLEEVIEKEMEFYNKLQSVLFFFAMVSIGIAILGVYSAITLDTEKRRKEMAIRKINGASGWRISGLFVRLYVKLLGITVLVTFPPLWWGIEKWQQDFAVHFYYGFWFWMLILCILLAVIALTVAWKIRAIVRVNPVEELRNE